MLARNPVSIYSLISWLKTRNPDEAYDFMSIGNCAFTQYVKYAFMYRGRLRDNTKAFEAWIFLHNKYSDVAELEPQTFGAMLERAELAQGETT